MRTTRARRRCDRGIQFFIELTPIGKTRQNILMGKLPRMLFRLDTPADFTPLYDQDPCKNNEEACAQQYSERQYLIVEFEFAK
jgi:hypothetical protein